MVANLYRVVSWLRTPEIGDFFHRIKLGTNLKYKHKSNLIKYSVLKYLSICFFSLLFRFNKTIKIVKC